jgi:hypothetical protein
VIQISNWTSTRKFYTKWEHVKFNKEFHIDFCCYYAQQVCFARFISFMLFTVEEFLIHDSRWFLKNNWWNLLGLCLFLLNTYSFPTKGTLTDWLMDWLMDELIRVGLGNLRFLQVNFSYQLSYQTLHTVDLIQILARHQKKSELYVYHLVWATKVALAAIRLVFPALVLGYTSFNVSMYHVPVPT